MDSVSIVSACFGSYDTIKEPVEQTYAGSVEWILVSDEEGINAPGWIVIDEDRPHVHPNVAAKVPKFRPDLYAPHSRYTIWADASALIQPKFVSKIVSKIEASRDGWAMFPHPNRTKITEEVDASRGLPKYDELDLEGQVRQYIGDGFPNDQLWASGIIGRDRYKNAINERVGNAWMTEVIRWGFQDQLSFPYVAWREGLRIEPITGSLWDNDIVWFDGHGRS